MTATRPCRRCNGTGKELDMRAIGESLRKQRLKSGMSLRTMAKRLFVSAMFLSDLERGRRNWTISRIEQFKAFLP